MTPQQFRDSHAQKHEVTICSIVPFPLPACIRPLYTPVSHYALEVASAEKPFHMVVNDCWQPEYSGENVGNRNLLVLAENIALDVVRDFTERIQGWAQGQQLGVFMCAGSRATAEEIAAAVIAQDRFFRSQIDLADEVWTKEGTGKNIRTLARQAAIALKIEREWLNIVTSGDTKECPACGERIKQKAELCRFCRTNVAEYLAAKVPAAVVLKNKDARLVSA